MCLKSFGFECTLKEVSKVMGVKPMVGASWEDAMAAAQHYGMRATLTMPSTVAQLKEWTDRGVPVMIGWNPEGRPWSHASVVFDVKEDGTVFVADPNIPNPEETVRVVSQNDFYGKWGEKAQKYIIRRPALAIEREITEDGQQISPWIPPASKGEIIRVANQRPGIRLKQSILGRIRMASRKEEKIDLGQIEKSFGANEALMRMTLVFGNQQCLKWLRATKLFGREDGGAAVDLILSYCTQGRGKCSELLRKVFSKMSKMDQGVLVEALGGLNMQKMHLAGQGTKMSNKKESGKEKAARWPEDMTPEDKKKWKEKHPDLAANAKDWKKYLKSARTDRVASADRVALQYLKSQVD